MVGKLCDEVRLVDELRAALQQLVVRTLEVGDTEVDGRALVVDRVVLRHAQHQPHVAAREEGERPRLEEVLEPEDVAIERHRRGQVARPDRDLANVLDRGSHVILLLSYT